MSCTHRNSDRESGGGGGVYSLPPNKEKFSVFLSKKHILAKLLFFKEFLGCGVRVNRNRLVHDTTTERVFF
jgi:hypothetical protein